MKSAKRMGPTDERLRERCRGLPRPDESSLNWDRICGKVFEPGRCPVAAACVFAVGTVFNAVGIVPNVEYDGVATHLTTPSIETNLPEPVPDILDVVPEIDLQSTDTMPASGTSAQIGSSENAGSALNNADSVVNQTEVFPEQPQITLPEGRYSAAKLCNTTLYWYHEPFVSDTLQWPGVPSGSRLFDVKNCTAQGAMLLEKCDVLVHVLSRWSFNVDIRTSDSRGALENNLAVSPFLWETVTRVDRGSAKSVGSDGMVRIVFGPCGFGLFQLDHLLLFSRSQMLGSGGISLDDKDRDYVPDEHPYRLITRIVAVDPAGRTTSRLTGAIENVMDELGLAIRVRPPLLVERKSMR